MQTEFSDLRVTSRSRISHFHWHADRYFQWSFICNRHVQRNIVTESTIHTL